MSKHLFLLRFNHETRTDFKDAAVILSGFKPYNLAHADQSILLVEMRLNAGAWSPMSFSTANEGTWFATLPVAGATSSSNVAINVEVRINEDAGQVWSLGDSICYAWENAPRQVLVTQPPGTTPPREGVMPSQVEITDTGIIISVGPSGALLTVDQYPLTFNIDLGGWVNADSTNASDDNSKKKTIADGGFATPTTDLQIQRQNIGTNGALIIAPLDNILTSFIETPPPPDFTGSGVITNPSAAGLSDGAIDVSVVGGVGPFSYAWADGPTTQDRTTIPSGTYTVIITDDGNPTNSHELVFIVLDPAIAQGLYRSTFVSASPLSPARFKTNEGIIDDSSVLKNPDNVNYCESPPENVSAPPYYEKFNISDAFKLQFKSDYEVNTLQLFDDQGAFIKTIQINTIVDNINDFILQSGAITDNGGGEIKVTSNSTLPVNTQVGNFITLDSFIGTYTNEYTIIAIESSDSPTWFTVKATWSVNENTDIKFLSNARYNILEAEISALGTLGLGGWKMKFVGGSGSLSSSLESENILVQSFTPNTLVMRYKNIDNAFDVDWSTGIEMFLRIEGFMIKSMPGRDASIHRNSNDSPEILNAYVRRKHEVNLFRLPWFGMERLALAVSCDEYYINDKRYVVEELPEPNQPARYMLSNTVMAVEEVGWLIDQNAHDNGAIPSSDIEVIGGEGQDVLGV